MAKPQRAKVGHPRCLPLAAPVAILAVLMAPAAQAQWRVVPSVELRETYTDNVRQEADDRARSQLITELTPALSIANEGPRLKLHAIATSHLYAYSDRVDGTNSANSQVQADAHANLVDDLFFIDGGGSIGQQAISAFGPQVNNNNGYSNANRTNVTTWRISPYLAHRFGNTFVSELRYTRDSVRSGNVGLNDTSADMLSLSLASGANFRTVGWSLQTSRQNVDDAVGGKFHTENALAALHFQAGRDLTFDTSGGYDKYDYQGPGGTSSGKSYSLGLTWTPSLRTSIKASVGHRFFGPSYLLALSHRSRGTVWSINYNDSVTTTREQLLIPALVNAVDILDRLFSVSIPDPAARRLAIDAYIRANGLPPSLAHNVNYFSNRYFLQRQFQASMAFNTARTTSVVAFNASRRTALSSMQADNAPSDSAPLGLNDSTRQAGASVLVSYRLSPRSAASLALSDARSESLTTGINDDRKSVSLSMTSQLQRKLKGAVELRRTQGNVAVAGGSTYHENAVSASLSYQL